MLRLKIHHGQGAASCPAPGASSCAARRGPVFYTSAANASKHFDPPFIDLHAATWSDDSSFELAPGARRFENWESYVAGRVGLAAAVDYALEIGLETIEQRVTHLAATLREKLEALDGVTVHDQGERRCAIVTLAKADEEAEALARRLAGHRINISVSSRDSARLDLGQRGLDALARASVHYFNTEEEIERLCQAVNRT